MAVLSIEDNNRPVVIARDDLFLDDSALPKLIEGIQNIPDRLLDMRDFPKTGVIQRASYLEHRQKDQ